MEDHYLNKTAAQVDALLDKIDGVEARAQVNVQSDWNEADSTKDDFIKNKPSLGAAAAKNVDSVPTDFSENLVESGGVYTALSGKVDTNGTDSLMTADEHTKLSGIESGAEVNVQSDWNQNDSTADDFVKNKPSLAAVATSGSYSDLSNTPTIPAAQVNSDWEAASGVTQILNKPTLGTAAALNVPASGDAAVTEVVKGDDSRLTDARHADDVYSWAKAANKPAYSSSEVSDLSNLTTTDKTSLVGAVNELNAIIGDVNTVLEEVL